MFFKFMTDNLNMYIFNYIVYIYIYSFTTLYKVYEIDIHI